MRKHFVKQGESLASIAAQYKISDWEKIYSHEANARFKEIRQNPDCIYPGDLLYIPDTEPTIYQFSTNQKHVVKVNVAKQKLSLQLKKAIDEDLQSVKYEIQFGGQTIKGECTDGKIEEEVPVSQGKGILKIWPDSSAPDFSIEYPLALGHLNPEDEISGLQARLQNLGYYQHAIDDDFGEFSAEALRDFQIDHGLDPTGKLDQDTKDQLANYFTS